MYPPKERIQRFGEPTAFAPSRQNLRELPIAERDALIALIHNHARELSAQSIQRRLPEKPSLAATRATLQNLAQRNLVVKGLFDLPREALAQIKRDPR